jgi:hypothetical protein
MKRITVGILLALASVFATGAASAADRAVQANVPFDFTVGDRLLPAGTYTIGSLTSGVIVIRSKDNKFSLMTTTSPDSNESVHGGKLVFDRYGDQYFLSEVLCPTAAISASLPKSRLEKKVSMQQAHLQSAGKTMVAAK